MNQEVQGIINSYRKISYYLFNLGVILLPFLIAIFISLWFASEDKNVSSKVKNLSQAYKTIDWVYYWNPIYSDQNGQKIGSWYNVKFIKDFFDSKNFRSQSAVIEKDWIVLPYSFGLSDEWFFSTLTWNITDTQRLQLYMESLKNPLTSVRLASYSPSFWTTKSPRGLAGKKLFDIYGLKCLNQLKITDYFCKQSVQKFVDDIPSIDITQDREWLKRIIWLLSADKKTLACEWVYKFTQNSWKTLDKQYLFWCDEKLQKKYENLLNFISATSQIEKWFSTVLGWDDEATANLLNHYMIVSYIQKVITSKYSEFQVWSYITLISKLIQEKKLKPGFYADLVNYFNNSILVSEIDKLQKDGWSSDWISKRKDDINDINNWRWINMTPLTQLSTLTFNSDTQQINTWTPTVIALNEKIENSLRSIENFEYKNNSLKRISSTDNSWSYEWSYNIWEEKFWFTGFIIFKNNSIYVTSIKSQKTKVDEDVNYKLSTPVSTSQLEWIIKKSYEIYWNIVSFCDSLDKEIKVKNCSEDRIIIDVSWENVIISFNGNSITSIKTSNKDFQAKLNTINIAVLSKKNFSSLVYSNIKTVYESYKSSNQNQNTQVKSNDNNVSVAELNKIWALVKNYLPWWVTIVKKLSDWNSYTIAFSASDLELRWVLNLALNNKLDNIYVTDSSPARKIYWLEFFIIPWEWDTFGQFVKDPWPFIQQADSDFYNSYKNKSFSQ